MITIKSPLTGASAGTLAKAELYCKDDGPFATAYLRELYRLCVAIGLRFEIAFGQFADETARGTSELWRTKGNPCGLGALDGGVYVGLTYTTGQDAARAQLVHLWLYAVGPLLPAELAPYVALDPRWKAAQHNAGKATTLAFLATTWATNPNYAVQIAAHANAAFGDLPEVTPALEGPREDTDTMALPALPYSVNVPGLEGGPLRTNHPVELYILPLDGYQRPGKPFYGAPILIQHGTGNPNSSAASESVWLVDQKASGNQQSYHYITDHLRTRVCLPLDEHGWHAADGNGPGNLRGIANEMIESGLVWNDTAKALKCIENTAEIMGRTHARKKAKGATGPKQHWDFNYLQTVNRHDCPNKLRYRWLNGRKAWDIYVERYNYYLADELTRMGQPVVAIFKAGDTIEATGVINIRSAAGTSAAIIRATSTGEKATVGTPAFVLANGYQWYNVTFANGTKGWVAGELFVKVATPAPPAPKTFTALRDVQMYRDPADPKSVVGTLVTGKTGTIISSKTVGGVVWYDLSVPGFGTGHVPGTVSVPTIVIK